MERTKASRLLDVLGDSAEWSGGRFERDAKASPGTGYERGATRARREAAALRQGANALDLLQRIVDPQSAEALARAHTEARKLLREADAG
jgi:hypothetical protein